MRKHADGVTVAALARTEAIRQVLGGGDPRIAYNMLKHILLDSSDDLAVSAASYSLGFASDGGTHLDRLTDFGQDYGYDQRQARRYSDRGVLAVARQIGSEWVVEASPTLRAVILRWDADLIEMVVQTERHDFVEMREPIVEIVGPDGARTTISCTWEPATGSRGLVRRATHLCISTPSKNTSAGISTLWTGEIWPRFEVLVAQDDAGHTRTPLKIETLAARLQVRPSPRIKF